MISICVKQLNKRYRARDGDVAALADVDIEVAEGEFVTIVGPSGCGKSTLLYILGGFIGADGGTIEVGGKAVTGPGVDRGVVFQEYALFPWLTVAQNSRMLPSSKVTSPSAVSSMGTLPSARTRGTGWTNVPILPITWTGRFPMIQSV